MKVVFLDIDGVLNYNTSEVFDKNCVSNLVKITKSTGAVVVLISSWRCLYMYEQYKNHEMLINLEQMFKDNNIVFQDIAPYKGDMRSEEVAEYLQEHKVDSFVILDDCDYSYSVNYPNNWVQSWWFEKGLTEELADKAIRILEGD